MPRKYKHNHKNKHRVPFGWRVSSQGYHMVDPYQRGIILAIVRLFNTGYTLENICTRLMNDGCKTARNGKWYPTTVSKIIKQNIHITK